MRSTLGERFLMMNFIHGDKDSVFKALFTERMLLYIPFAYPLPLPPISLFCLRISVVLLVSPILCLLMFLTEPSLS